MSFICIYGLEQCKKHSLLTDYKTSGQFLRKADIVVSKARSAKGAKSRNSKD